MSGATRPTSDFRRKWRGGSRFCSLKRWWTVSGRDQLDLLHNDVELRPGETGKTSTCTPTTSFDDLLHETLQISVLGKTLKTSTFTTKALMFCSTTLKNQSKEKTLKTSTMTAAATALPPPCLLSVDTPPPPGQLSRRRDGQVLKATQGSPPQMIASIQNTLAKNVFVSSLR